jgi:hypothetical protein
MAPETYYLAFSFIAVLGCLVLLARILLIRTGHDPALKLYKPTSVEYQNLQRVARTKVLVYTILALLAFAVNLLLDVRHILALPDKNYPHATLIYIPAGCTFIAIVVSVQIYGKYHQSK